MKTVCISNGVVSEVIPAYALPVEKWYGTQFAAQCVEAPDEVEQGWTYNAQTGAFSEPVTPTPALDELTQLQLALTELAEIVLGGVD